MFGTPQQQQQPAHQFQSPQNGPFGGQNMFSSSMSQPNLFASSGSSGSANYSPAAGQNAVGMGYGPPTQLGTPQGPNFGMSQNGYQGGFNQSPGAFGAPQPASAGPRYMPGYLMKQATPSRSQSHSFSSSLHHTASAEEMANTSLDREANSNSPPHTRGSIFGSASTSRNGGSLFSKKGAHAGSSSMVDDDAPPIQSLDDMDELPGASSGSNLSPPKLSHRPLSTSPNDSGSQMSQAAATTPGSDAPKVIIFGFSRSALPQVLDHLSLIGPIVSVETPSNPSANWATITFQEAWQAARAIRRNGEVIQNGALILGVKWADPSRTDAASLSAAAPTSQLALSAPKANTAANNNNNSIAKSTSSYFGASQPPSTPQHQQQQPTAPPAVGTPVPILGSAYKNHNSQNASGRWTLGGLMGGSTPQHGQNGGQSAAAQNPFTVQQQQQGQAQQGGGVWSKVSDAIFGF